MRIFKTYSLGNFQGCNIVLLTTVTMLYFISSWHVYFITGSWYILTFSTHFSHPLPHHLWQAYIQVFIYIWNYIL